MKKSVSRIGFLMFSVFLLTGCNALDDLEDILKNVFAENNKENVEEHVEALNGNDDNDINENDETNEEESSQEMQERDSHDVDDSFIPFDERLIAQGYTMYSLPNGFPFEIPYHWVYVGNDQADEDHMFAGQFCYDLPQSVQDVADYFGHFHGISHQYFGENEPISQTTTFQFDVGFGNIDVTLDFYMDDFNNTCVYATITDDMDAPYYGEDPDTMVSKNELAMNDTTTHNGPRSTPSDYESLLDDLRTGGALAAKTIERSEIQSISDKIYNNAYELLHLVNGEPTIFPYEWYLLDQTYLIAGWYGTLCTDRPMNETIVKHHDMLAAYDANIDHFSMEEGPKPNIVSEVSFSFNDAYGTGSWNGLSMFFAAPEGSYPFHNCVTVEMEFSSERIH